MAEKDQHDAEYDNDEEGGSYTGSYSGSHSQHDSREEGEQASYGSGDEEYDDDGPDGGSYGSPRDQSYHSGEEEEEGEDADGSYPEDGDGTGSYGDEDGNEGEGSYSQSQSGSYSDRSQSQSYDDKLDGEEEGHSDDQRSPRQRQQQHTEFDDDGYDDGSQDDGYDDGSQDDHDDGGSQYDDEDGDSQYDDGDVEDVSHSHRTPESYDNEEGDVSQHYDDEEGEGSQRYDDEGGEGSEYDDGQGSRSYSQRSQDDDGGEEGSYSNRTPSDRTPSYHSDEGSHRSREGEQYDEDPSHSGSHSDRTPSQSRSYYSDEGSHRSRNDEQYDEDPSHSGSHSDRTPSQSRSYYSDEGSHRSRDDAQYDGDPSHSGSYSERSHSHSRSYSEQSQSYSDRSQSHSNYEENDGEAAYADEDAGEGDDDSEEFDDENPANDFEAADGGRVNGVSGSRGSGRLNGKAKKHQQPPYDQNKAASDSSVPSSSSKQQTRKERKLPYHQNFAEDGGFDSSVTGTSGVDSFANEGMPSRSERSYDPFAQNATVSSKGGGWTDSSAPSFADDNDGQRRDVDSSGNSGVDSFANEPSFANESIVDSFANEASFAAEDGSVPDFSDDVNAAPQSAGITNSPRSPGERYFSSNVSDDEEYDDADNDAARDDQRDGGDFLAQTDDFEDDGSRSAYSGEEDGSHSNQSRSYSERSPSHSRSPYSEEESQRSERESKYDEEPSQSGSYSERSPSRSQSYHDDGQMEQYSDGDEGEEVSVDEEGNLRGDNDGFGAFEASADFDDPFRHDHENAPLPSDMAPDNQFFDEYDDVDQDDDGDDESGEEDDSFFEKTLISREPDMLPRITEHSVEQSIPDERSASVSKRRLPSTNKKTRNFFASNDSGNDNESFSSFQSESQKSPAESVQRSVDSVRSAARSIGSRPPLTPGSTTKSLGGRSLNSRGYGSTGSVSKSPDGSYIQRSVGEGSVTGSVRSMGSRSSASRRSATSIEILKERLKRTTSLNNYSREQMQKVIKQKHGAGDGKIDAKLEQSHVIGESKSKARRPKVSFKSEELLELVADVNAAMSELEESERSDWAETKEIDIDSTAKRLLYGFEALTGIQLQISDELELMSTFARKKDAGAIEALDLLLTFAPILCDIFSQLKPILLKHLVEEIGEEMNDFLYCMNLSVDLLCEVAHDVGEKQEWNLRVNTVYATLLELLSRDTLEVCCISDDVDTPEYEPSETVEEAWNGTGHEDEFKILHDADDLDVFRQVCYDVLVSMDQWCPDTKTLMDICWIEASMLEDQVIRQEDDERLSEPPEAALQVLEKINGDPLPRSVSLARIMRRILPTDAITDSTIRDQIFTLKNDIRIPLELPSSNLIAISSVPEVLNEPEALGVTGVGKTTLAAMVANHPDVRRFFDDGIAWIHVGRKEINYSRYVLCLREIVGQLGVPEDEEPLFPELLHIPGESKAKRRRREEGFMFYVRDIMTDFLKFRNVLIIVDDICFEPDLDWFDFDPADLLPDDAEEEFTCAILVTTRCRNLLPSADTIEVDMLEEREAIELLIWESSDLSEHLSPDTPEVRSVVQECANHPLAVKSVARWLNLKHATAGTAANSTLHADVVKSMEKVLKKGRLEDADMMYEILSMSLSPAINGEPTSIIKFCFAAFVLVFCDQQHLSDFALVDATPIVPLIIAEKLFVALLDLEEESLMQEGSLFYAQKKEAAVLIPEALTALGVLKGIATFSESGDDGSQPKEVEEKYLQVMHSVQEEYGEFLKAEDSSMSDLMKDGERRWNRAFAEAYMDSEHAEWDTESPDSGLDYALEMLPSHMIRGDLLFEAATLLADSAFVRGRLFALGRENGTRRHIKDCESLFDTLMEQRVAGKKKLDPKSSIKQAYQILGGLLNMDEDEYIAEPGSPEALEVARSQYEIGFSLAEKRCWEAAIAHWESSQELLVSALGMVEIVAGIQLNVGVVYAEMNEYEQALSSLKQCLRIRGALHGEEHILYAQTIQKIGDIFLSMSDYHESMESYNWALDVMHIEPSHHRIDIGDILENMGNIHYSKGEIDEALQCFQDALRSKQVDLGDDHPELSTTYHHIGNCLSDQGKTEEAIVHFEEAIRLKQMDPDGGGERDAEVLTIQGVLHNLNGRQQDGLECYEKALQILVTKVPHKKEKVASLLHLIGCVYLMSGEHKKAMKLFEESLQARRKVLGFVHLDVASTLFNMAFLHQSRGKLDKALKCLEEALKIRQLRLPDSEKVSVTHEKIGTLARSLGKTKKAEVAFSEALRIRKLIHGDSHEAVATVLQELGDLMDDLGEYDDAMKHYVEALNIRQARLGQDDLAVAETMYSMGFCLQNKEASERALQCFDEALAIRQFVLGEDAKEVGDTLNMMGFLQAQRGELEEALALLWDALRIRKLREDHIKVSETLKNIGNVHREKLEYELALECYEECLRIRRAELGDDHEKVADALIAIGNVQSDMGNSDDAMRSYEDGK